MKTFLFIIFLLSGITTYEGTLKELEKYSWTIKYQINPSFKFPNKVKNEDFQNAKKKCNELLSKIFNSDKEIINYFLEFVNDTSSSNYISAFPKNTTRFFKRDTLYNRTDINFLILLENYLKYDGENLTLKHRNEILFRGFNTGIYLLDPIYIKQWWEENKNLELDSLRIQFKKDSAKHKYKFYE